MAAISVMFLLCIWQIYDVHVRYRQIPGPEQSQVAQRVLEKIERMPGPVWSEDMTLAMIAGKDVIAEPAIVTELSYQGVWDQEPFLDWIRERKFDAVIINSAWWPRRYTPEMKAAVMSYYPVVETIGRYKIYYPPTSEQQ